MLFVFVLLLLFIVWFGIGEMFKIVFIVFVMFFLVYFNFYNGICSVDVWLIDVGCSFGLLCV